MKSITGWTLSDSQLMCLNCKCWVKRGPYTSWALQMLNASDIERLRRWTLEMLNASDVERFRCWTLQMLDVPNVGRSKCWMFQMLDVECTTWNCLLAGHAESIECWTLYSLSVWYVGCWPFHKLNILNDERFRSWIFSHVEWFTMWTFFTLNFSTRWVSHREGVVTQFRGVARVEARSSQSGG
jgi:hypothetical protein